MITTGQIFGMTYVVVGCLGFLGNGIIGTLFLMERAFQRNPFYLLLAHLCLVDGVCCVIIGIYSGVVTYTGSVFCGFLEHIFSGPGDRGMVSRSDNLNPSNMWTRSSTIIMKIAEKFEDDFDVDGRLDSIAPFTVGPTLVNPCPAGTPAISRLRAHGAPAEHGSMSVGVHSGRRDRIQPPVHVEIMTDFQTKVYKRSVHSLDGFK